MVPHSVERSVYFRQKLKRNKSVVINFTPEATICIIKSKLQSLKQSIKLICDMLYAEKYVLPN